MSETLYENILYSRTSISGGAWAGNYRVSSSFPGYNFCKKPTYYKIFCHLTIQTTKTVWLKAVYSK